MSVRVATPERPTAPREPRLSETVAGVLAWLERLPAPERPRLIQTHISWVILAGPFVYKLKKPLNLGFLDFSTREKRLAACEREVALNRRLCPWVYLGIVPIVERDGEIAVGDDGEVIDHAVWMRRLPEDRMLNVMLERGQVTTRMVAEIADRLAAFHATAATGPGVDEHGQLETIRANAEENFAQTRAYIGRTIDERTWLETASATRRFLSAQRALFERRVADGRVRDGHGDLHAASICLTDPIAIFDCIEFNDRFRCADVAAEVAFLAMDLERFGRPDLADAFVDHYVKVSGDDGVRAVLDYYLSYRAFVRGKVESFRLDEPEFSDEQRAAAAARAAQYFQLAGRYAARLTTPQAP